MAPKPQIIMSSDAVSTTEKPSLIGLSDAAAPAAEMRETLKLGAVPAKEAVAAATAATQQATEVTKDATAQIAKTAKAASEQAKQQFEALVQASTIVAKGADEVSREVSGYMQASLSGAADVAKAMLSARTLQDVMKIQSDYVKASFDSMVGNSSKISEIGVRVATEAWAPIASRLQQSVEKMARPAA